MSWSVSAMGKPAAVAAKLAADFARMQPMAEPEESVKNNAAASIASALAAYPSNFLVRVEANGSQYRPNNDAAECVNTHTLKIESLGTLVE